MNSGITLEITPENVISFPSIFALLYGWGGKTGINCFVLITGYFMCKSNITAKKFLKLLLEVEFYKIIIYFLFVLSGYEQFSMMGAVTSILPVYSIGTGFTQSFLVFYLLIPYLNLLIRTMNEKQHLNLVGLCFMLGTVLQTFLNASNMFTYVGWFMVLYFAAAYIRCYEDGKVLCEYLSKVKIHPQNLFGGAKRWGGITSITLILAWGSVIVRAFIYRWTGGASSLFTYYFISDSNKLFAVLTAICAFLFFKNLEMKYHPVINRIAASAFGVLMIHANSDVMRQWLWRDVLNNVRAYHSNYFVIHAIISIVAVYATCTLIDMFRIKFIEKPVFRCFVKRGSTRERKVRQ